MVIGGGIAIWINVPKNWPKPALLILASQPKIAKNHVTIALFHLHIME